MKRSIANVRTVRRLASGNNAWTVVDSGGQVRHVIAHRNADGDPLWGDILVRVVNANVTPKLHFPNDAPYGDDTQE